MKLMWCTAKYNFDYSARRAPWYNIQTYDALSCLQITHFRHLTPQAEQHPHICPSKVVTQSTIDGQTQ